uniref:DUF753 domain-containing protein n=1 Tax=Anopheles merus TaxID=30066 RepID=A0A182VN40_ANOME
MMRISLALPAVLICFQLFHQSEAAVTQCLVCDSSEPGCADGSMQYARNCTMESEACFTSVTNGVLLRGCLSQLREEHLQCNEKEGGTCISCIGNRCNTVSWARCAHCDDAGTESCTVRQLVSFCPRFRATDRCYEIVENVQVPVSKAISKGCESTLIYGGILCNETNNCRIADKHSISCAGSSTEATKIQCLVCSSDDDSRQECTKECIDIVISGTLESSFCPQFLPNARCFERIVEDEFERGCSAESEDVCAGNNRCLACAEDGCNVESETNLNNVAKCFRCTSVEGSNEACDEGALEAEECDQLQDDCYTRVQDVEQQKCRDEDDTTCYACEDHECNHFPRLRCYRCSSLEDPRCNNQAESDLSYEFCDTYKPDDHCYARIVDDHIERGCRVDLQDHVGDVCAGNPFCYACYRSGCNGLEEDTLKNMARCLTCSTDRDGEECGKAAMEAELCEQLDDVCFTRVTDNNLERGCLTTLEVDEQNKCRDASNGACVTCQTPACNTQNWLKCLSCKKSDNLQWPQCYRCQSADQEDNCNQTPGPALLGFCPTYQENIFCYAAIEDGILVRDCTDTHETICEDQNRCVVCQDEGCNDISRDVLDTVQTCLQCRSDVEDCDHPQQPPFECRERNDQCFTMVDREFNLHRGCVSDLDLNDCLDGDRCMICVDKNCNDAPWAKCYQCNNATSDECSGKQVNSEGVKYCQQYEENGGCYAKLEQMIFTRGCTSELEDLPCDDPQACVHCIGDGCNHASLKGYFNPAVCLQCHSDMNTGCTDGTAPAVACANPDDRCFFRRASSKAIHRGCLSELAATDQWQCQSETSTACHTCEEPGCNSAEWRRCYKCRNLADGSCSAKQTEQNSTFLEFCMKQDDSCFEDNNEGDIYRGCGKHFCADQKICLECTTDACNGHSQTELEPSQCLVCDSDNPFCANGTAPSSYCEYLNEPCYSMVRENGILERGCFSNLTDSYKSMCMDIGNRSCIACSGNSCNHDSWLQCVQCRSLVVDHYCSREMSPLESHFCPRFEPNDRCYAKDVHGLVLRGCQSDYDSMDDPCKGSEENDCYTCSIDHCNLKSLNGVDRVPKQDVLVFVVITIAQHLLILLD